MAAVRWGAMKKLKVVLGIVVALLAALFLIGGMLLPTGQYVERSAVIDAEPERVFALVSDYREFNRWSPWAALDPDAEYEFKGPPASVGSRMIWRSDHPDFGNGEQEVIEIQPGVMVRSRLTHERFDTPSYATFTVVPTPNGTRVTWAFDANMDSMLGPYMGLLVEDWVGAYYERGLASLKELAEKAD